MNWPQGKKVFALIWAQKQPRKDQLQFLRLIWGYWS